MTDTKGLKVFNTVDALNYAAAEFFVTTAQRAIAVRGRFVICLSGGETPKGLYELLAELPFREQICWKNTFIFFGDERCVPLDDERNNAHQVKLLLADKINMPLSNFHFIPVNLRPTEAAHSYEKELKLFFEEQAPSFDIMLLGLGENGHIASLFPGADVLTEQAEGIRAVYIEKDDMFRITMTAPLINQARHILFLVTGENKATVLKKVLKASYQPDKTPAQLIKPVNGDLHWLVDSAAAAYLLSI